jgi:hypothetical protein
MSIITIILSLIGLFTLLLVAYFFWRRYLIEKQHYEKRKMRYPPESYIEKVGNLCPDYWVYQPIDDKNHMCVNSFKVPVNDPSNPVCYDVDINGKRSNHKVFNSITDFPLKKGDMKLKSRCEWIANCGINKGMKGFWGGIDDLCPVNE